jgi:hypothetical protein
MTQTAEQLKALVLDAFDTLFNTRDYAAADEGNRKGHKPAVSSPK